MRIVQIVGTDGAGKTTIATRIAAELKEQGWDYLYCQVRPLLLRPVSWLGRATVLRKTDQFRDYDGYLEKKRAIGRRRRLLTRLYALAWYAEFLLQTWPRMVRARLRGRNIIVDRYCLDMVVNLGVLQDNGVLGMLGQLRVLQCLLPVPEQYIFLDVAEEVALSRKGDIQSLSYLRARKARYLGLAPSLRFSMVDAGRPLEAVAADVRSLILPVH